MLAEAVCRDAEAWGLESEVYSVPIGDINNLSTFVDTIKLARGL